MTDTPLHIQTPLLRSGPLSRALGGAVWLKLESLQPSGSFKLRGIGRACSVQRDRGARHFISSSGGNAGVAIAHAGKALGIPVTVVVPRSSSAHVIEVIRQAEARVMVRGETWQEAHEHACSLTDNAAVYIHPFDDPLIWEGHSTLIDEVMQSGLQPEIIVLAVGGGGLLCGTVSGLHRHGLVDLPVVAVETRGAHSLAASLDAGELVSLDRITSIATSLGAKRVARAAFDWSTRHPVISHVVSDAAALGACRRFADDHRQLVEPACGAALAAVYQPIETLRDKRIILVIVCGGIGATLEQLDEWHRQLSQEK